MGSVIIGTNFLSGKNLNLEHLPVSLAGKQTIIFDNLVNFRDPVLLRVWKFGEILHATEKPGQVKNELNTFASLGNSTETVAC